MNIIDNTNPKAQALGLLDTKPNVLYQGEQSGKFYLGLRAGNGGGSRYLAELSSGTLLWNGLCKDDTTFIEVQADVVIKN